MSFCGSYSSTHCLDEARGYLQGLSLFERWMGTCSPVLMYDANQALNYGVYIRLYIASSHKWQDMTWKISIERFHPACWRTDPSIGSGFWGLIFSRTSVIPIVTSMRGFHFIESRVWVRTSGKLNFGDSVASKPSFVIILSFGVRAWILSRRYSDLCVWDSCPYWWNLQLWRLVGTRLDAFAARQTALTSPSRAPQPCQLHHYVLRQWPMILIASATIKETELYHSIAVWRLS